LSALTLALIASVSHAEGTAAPRCQATATKGQTLSAGIATQYIESSVRPQDDFFEYLNGKWLKTVEIPSDKSSWGSFMQAAREHPAAAARHHRERRRQEPGQGHRRPAHRRLLRQLHGRSAPGTAGRDPAEG
jgi:hypothetical protein